MKKVLYYGIKMVALIQFYNFGGLKVGNADSTRIVKMNVIFLIDTSGANF